MPSILKIIDAKYIGSFTLRLKFSDGRCHEVDFQPFLENSAHPDVRKYLNQKKFKNYSLKDGELMWGDFDLIFPVADLYKKSVID